MFRASQKPHEKSHYKPKDRPDSGPFKGIALATLLTILFVLSSCYSSTAVKGTPVKELVEARDPSVIKVEKVTDIDRAELAKMSQVKGNEVFVEIEGVPEYRIGPLDILEITSRVGDKRTTTQVTVNNRGKISYSFIDDLGVAGHTASQLDDVITRQLSNYIRNPRIDVLVKEFNSKFALLLGEFSILRGGVGETIQSGRIFLDGRKTLTDLIAQGRGFTANADIRRIKLSRAGKSFIINLFDIIEKADETQNVIINHGDIVSIPDLPEIDERVYVMGEVGSQGILALEDARDLLGAIALAGNVTKLAVEENTLVVRGYELGKKPQILMVDINAMLRKGDMAQNIPLQDGDLVYVPRMVIGDINEWFENTTALIGHLTGVEGDLFFRRYLHLDPSGHRAQ